MTRFTPFAITALLAVVLLVGGASAGSHVTIGNIQMNSGGTATADVILDSIDPDDGLAGYSFNIAIANPSLARVSAVTYNPALGGLTSTTTLPFTSGHIAWTDTAHAIEPAGTATNIVLATVTIQGLSAGSTTLGSTFSAFDGDGPNWADLIPTSSIDNPTIMVYSAPVAAFTFLPASPLVGDAVIFTDASTGGITSWDMNFGDGSAHASGPGPWTHAYSAANTYHATLTVNNPMGPSSSVTHDVVVASEPVPVPAFSVAATNAVGSVTPTFTQSSTGTITGYLWESRLADNGAWSTFSTAATPSGIAFTNPGTYDIRLTVSNGGGSASQIKTHQFSVGLANGFLTTVGSGTVSGDLFVDSVSPWTTSATQAFTLPAAAVGNVQWARLYVNTYSGSYSSQYGLTSVVQLDGTTLGTETLDVWKDMANNPITYPVNDHVMKTTSDYEATYDVTTLITTATPSVTVTNTALPGYTFDGRIKGITLVVAYNDGDTDTVRYIVNHGSDWMGPAGTTHTTAFDASAMPAGWTSANLKTIAHSSTDGTYTLNSGGITKTSLLSGSYIKFNSFDVTSSLTPASSNTLGFTAVGSSFKTTIAALKARYVVPPAITSFTSSNNPASVGQTVTFTAAATGSPTSWDVDFGDGTAHATGTGPWTHSYAAANTYTVVLTATNEGGSDTRTISQVVTSNPIISFVPATQTFLPGETRTYDIVMDAAPAGLAGYDMVVSLANTAPADIVSVTYPAWAQMTRSGTFPADSLRISGVDTNQQIWPGATNVLLATITVRGNANGNSQIQLSSVVMDADGGAAITPVLSEGTVQIGSYTGPVAAFTGTPVTGNYPLTVAFDSSTSTGTITTYQWDFTNDGTIDSTAANPSFTYNAIGSYSVKLTVSGPGGSDSEVKNAYITVTDGTAPTATIVTNPSPATGNYPLPVAFSATTTGNVASYAWDFGDGVHSSLAAPTHTYTYPGTFTVTLVVFGTGGSSAPATATVTVTQNAPVAGIIATPTSGTAPLLVQFYDQSTGTITSYDWDFGDGSAHSTAANPAHEYTTAGTFTVTHTVTGPGGTSAPATVTITTTGLTVDFTAPVTTGTASALHPFTATFTATATPSSGTTYMWDFGDGQTGTGATVTHDYYGHLGSFTVTVTATNGADVASKTRTNYISTTPYLEAFPLYDNAGSINGYYAGLPQDLNGDHVYEDVNSNGRVDYDDVVAFYNALYYGWFTTNTDVDNIPDYDYTGDSLLNTTDVVALYDRVLYG